MVAAMLDQACYRECIAAGLSETNARLLAALNGLVRGRDVEGYPFEVTEIGPRIHDLRLFRASCLPAFCCATWVCTMRGAYVSAYGSGWCVYWRRHIVATELGYDTRIDIIRLTGVNLMLRDLTFLRLAVDA